MAKEPRTTDLHEQSPPADQENTGTPVASTAEEHVDLPEPGDVVVDFDKINELMAQRRAAERAKVEARETAEPVVEGDPLEQSPQPEDDAPALPADDAPVPGVDGKSAKVIDIGPENHPGRVDDREPWEKTLEELAAEKPKPKRGRPPKAAKSGPEAADKPSKSGKPRKGRTPKDQGEEHRDKVSQSGQGKNAPEQPAAGGPGSGPVVDAPADPTPPPRPVEEGKLVYLKLSEMHPFHTFRPHPFKVQDDAKMQETVESIKANGVMVPGLACPEKEGCGYEIIAGHRRCRGSELAGLEEMPFIVRDMSDHEAVQAMKDSNKQRDQMLPSELAALLELKVENIKHQDGRLKNVAGGGKGV